MSQISLNLTSRRKELGLTVEAVQSLLERAGVHVAYSTVAGWFNGSRGVRNVRHLRALCDVLQTDVNQITGDDIEIAEGKVEVAIARELRDLDPAQREIVLALVRSMKPGRGAR
jgi:transcriptional regulator with XRE-family HTH domain